MAKRKDRVVFGLASRRGYAEILIDAGVDERELDEMIKARMLL